MKLKLIRQFFGTEKIPSLKIGKIGPCVICKWMHRAEKVRYCHMGKLDIQAVLNYTNSDGDYYGCADFTLRNKRSRIKLL